MSAEHRHRRVLTEVEVEDEGEIGASQEESCNESPNLRWEFEDPGSVEDDMFETEQTSIDQSRLEKHRHHQDSEKDLASAPQFALLEHIPCHWGRVEEDLDYVLRHDDVWRWSRRTKMG